MPEGTDGRTSSTVSQRLWVPFSYEFRNGVLYLFHMEVCDGRIRTEDRQTKDYFNKTYRPNENVGPRPNKVTTKVEYCIRVSKCSTYEGITES